MKNIKLNEQVNRIKNLNNLINEIGNPKKESELKKFVKDFLQNTTNPFIMSMLFRMMSSQKFVKFGQEVYHLTDEEKNILREIEPRLTEIVKLTNELLNEVE